MPGEPIRKVTGKTGPRYHVTYDLPRGANGKRRQAHRSFATYKAARDHLTKVRHEQRSGSYVEPAKITISDLVERWLAVMERRIRPSTVHLYRNTARRRVLPLFGSRQIGSIQPAELDAYYGSLLAEGLSAKGVQTVHRIFRGAFGQAVTWRLIAHDPTISVRAPVERKPQTAVWSATQAQRLIQHTAEDPIYGLLWRLALVTGMRRGELVVLRWQDINLEEARVTIERTDTVTRDGKRAEGTPKTAAARRTVALPPSCTAALRWHRARQSERRLQLGGHWAAGDRVFDNGRGKVIPATHIRVHLHRAATALGLPLIRVHDLRHTAATLMLEQGVSPRVVQEILGHSSITMTLDRYSHVSVDLQRAALDRLDDSLNTPCDTVVTRQDG